MEKELQYRDDNYLEVWVFGSFRADHLVFVVLENVSSQSLYSSRKEARMTKKMK